jgi:hypothetical protein
MQTMGMVLPLLCLFAPLIATVHCALVRHHFVVRWVAWNPDGFTRPVIGVFEEDELFPAADAALPMHQPFPGPLIRAKLGDVVEVSVTNQLIDCKVLSVFRRIDLMFVVCFVSQR